MAIATDNADQVRDSRPGGVGPTALVRVQPIDSTSIAALNQRFTGVNHMTRLETLNSLVHQAQANGFDLRSWYETNISPEWPGLDEVICRLAAENHFYALIFSHDFAQALWRQGAPMNFVVPALTYSRMNGRGELETIHRKPFTRRTIKADVWRYHLREMAVSDDPMSYLSRFLPVQEPLWDAMAVPEEFFVAS